MEKPKQFWVVKISFKLVNVAACLKREIDRAYLGFNLKNRQKFLA
jgi:hypothetical protein